MTQRVNKTRGTAPPQRAARVAPAHSEALELLSAEDLAQRWGVRAKHIYTLVNDHGLPCVRLGKYLRFREASVMAWLDEREGRF